jgi:hypothetical protein
MSSIPDIDGYDSGSDDDEEEQTMIMSNPEAVKRIQTKHFLSVPFRTCWIVDKQLLYA